jgi:hypothetical protein
MQTGRSLALRSKGKRVAPSTSQPTTEDYPSAHLNSILTILLEGAWADTVRLHRTAKDLLSYFLA